MAASSTALNAHHPPRSAIAAAIGALLLAMGLAFLAGRASARLPVTPATAARPPADAAPSLEPAQPQPWSTHGFRDDESAQDGCVTTDCTG